MAISTSMACCLKSLLAVGISLYALSTEGTPRPSSTIFTCFFFGSRTKILAYEIRPLHFYYFIFSNFFDAVGKFCKEKVKKILLLNIYLDSGRICKGFFWRPPYEGYDLPLRLDFCRSLESGLYSWFIP